LYTEDAVRIIRVIASAAIGSLFVCGLFGGQGVAQTATESVDKLMHLLQPTNPGKSETKPSDRSAAKRPSNKAPPAAKKHASAKPAAKESTLNGASQVTPSELVIDGEAVRVASPDDANDIDLAGNAHSPPASDPSAAVPAVVRAVGTETIAPPDKLNSGAAAVSQTPSSSTGTMAWLLRVIAALSGAVVTGSIAWFLIGPSASADVWVSLNK
jgi:hypothetical protein